MQDLVEGREYIATLNNEYYSGQTVHIKYLGTDDGDCIDILVVTDALWEGRTDDSGVWKSGAFVKLYPEGYTFEEFNPILENK